MSVGVTSVNGAVTTAFAMSLRCSSSGGKGQPDELARGEGGGKDGAAVVPVDDKPWTQEASVPHSSACMHGIV